MHRGSHLLAVYVGIEIDDHKDIDAHRGLNRIFQTNHTTLGA